MTSPVRALRIAAFLVTAVAAADVGWTLLGVEDSSANADSLPRLDKHGGVSPPRHPAATFYLESIAGRDLFKAAPADSTPPDLPVSALGQRYELTGTVVGSDRADSMAIVRERTLAGDGPSRMLRIGDSFDTHAKVAAIEGHRVLLRTASGPQQLPFAWDDDEAREASPPAPGTLASNSDLGAEISRAADGIVTIGASTLDRYLKDPAPLLTQARVAVSSRNGRPDGFRFQAIQRGSIFERLGLENGDVLRTLDGREIASLDVALAELQTLSSKRDFRATVLRGEQERTLVYRVR